MPKFYFRCKANPKAPLFVTTELWEAKSMAAHAEYERVDENGVRLESTDEAFVNARPVSVDALL